MRHLLSPITTMPISPSSSSSNSSTSSQSSKPRKPSSSSSSSNPNPNCNSLVCKHSHSATLDIFFLILVLFSGSFLLTSYFSYIFQSLSLLLPPLSLSSLLLDSPLPYVLGFVFVFIVTFCGVEICCGHRSRKCEKIGCKGMKKALEFDLQLQTEECLKSSLDSKDAIDKLPWKGGTEGNPDYECLRSELRKMAPPNGRAVLLFRARCGCPVAKLEGWGPKRGRKHKKGLALNGGGDRR